MLQTYVVNVKGAGMFVLLICDLRGRGYNCYKDLSCVCLMGINVRSGIHSPTYQQPRDFDNGNNCKTIARWRSWAMKE